MANILDSIQLSGSSYDLRDKSATTMVNVTQAEYDALVSGGTVDPTILYNITDAQAGDLSQYWTSAQTNSAITQAVSGKQDTLVSGTNIKTVNNESLLGSGNITIQGGSTYSAGTNISIDTANTISCTLPITIDNSHSIVIPNNTNNSVRGSYNFVGGRYCNITNYQGGSDPDYAFCYGRYNNVYTESETAFGKFNVSRRDQTVGGSSATTIFTVGNGGNANARHNAFEIRQNGDIYCSDGTNDVKLQDTITATAANTTALGGLKLVKLTQSEYDNLSTKDNSTLYVIVN